jgi:hypothetical protein
MVTMPGTPNDSWSPEGEAQTKAITAREPVPYKPDMGLQIKPDQNPYEAFRGDTDFAERSTPADVDWKERFVQHFRNAQQYGTPGLNELGEIQDADMGYVGGVGVGPEAGKQTADFLRDMRKERQAEFEGMKPAETVGDYAAAVGGAVAGAVTDPLSLVGPVVKIGTTGWRMAYPVVSRLLDHGVSNAAMNVALNGAVQAEEFGADVRDEVDWLSLGVDAAAGFAFGVPFGYVDGKAAADFYSREAARAATAPPAPGQAPPQPSPAPAQPQTMAPPTAAELQAEYSAQDLAQAQEDLFGEVVGTRNLTPEQAAQLDDYLNAGRAGDIPQAEPETPGGLTNDPEWQDMPAPAPEFKARIDDMRVTKQAAGTEPGADNKPQMVIPGAERAAPKTMAERQAAAPLRSAKPQKSADFGLFGDTSQLDLVDLSRVARRVVDDAATVDLRPSSASKQAKIGNSTISYAAREGEIEILSIRTPIPLRGQGAAREALVAFLDRVDAQGLAVRAHATALDRMTNPEGVLRFYQSLGFTPTGNRDWRGGLEVLRAEPPPELKTLRTLVGEGRLIPLQDYREAGLAKAVGDAFIGTQPERTFDELYGGALQRNQNRLAQAGQRIADELGINFGNPGIKKRETSEAKMGRKGYRSTKQLTDLVRAGFKVQTPDQANRLVNMLAEEFQILDEGWNVTDVSYFDRKLLVKFDDGTIGEVQIWEPGLYAAKHPIGHAMYEEARMLPMGDPRKVELEQAQRERYEGVISELTDDWLVLLGRPGRSGNVTENASRQAPSSGSTLPESTTSATSTSVQSSPGASTAQARGPSDTAGRYSQSKNFIGESSVSPEARASGDANQPGYLSQDDPLAQAGPWREATIMAVDEQGKAVQVNAGDAVDFMVTRIQSLRQLLECINAG